MSLQLLYEVSGSNAQCDSPELKCGVQVPYKSFEYHSISSLQLATGAFPQKLKLHTGRPISFPV